MIILGMVNLLLLIGYAGIIFGRRVSLITGLLYATEPLVVISSRTVQAENFLITGFLLTLLSLYFYFKTKRGELFWLTVSLCGLFTLVKLSAVSLMLTVIVLILIFDRYRPFLKSFLTLLGTILIWLFFPVLGLIYDFNLFIKVLRFNSGRFMRDGLNVVYALFTHQNITRDFSSGFVPLGLIATASLASEASTKKNYYWVVTPMLTYLLVYIIFGSEGYGWYKYPLFPWLFLSIAIIMDRSMEKFNSLFILLLTFIPGGIMINRFINAEQLMPYLWLFRIFTILMFTLTFTPLIFSGNKHIRLFQTIFITSILLFLVSLNIFTNLAITPDAWYNFNFLKSI
jgi:4-amino-4-deoxy-L-arabinose transferase-like glycosyltransferase